MPASLWLSHGFACLVQLQLRAAERSEEVSHDKRDGTVDARRMHSSGENSQRAWALPRGQECEVVDPSSIPEHW